MDKVYFSMSEKVFLSISSTPLNAESFIEGFCIEINIRKKKWLLVCTYNSNKNIILNHFILLNMTTLFVLVILILKQLNQ